MSNDPLYDIFHFFSRILIFVPIAIVLVGLFMKFNQPKKPTVLSNVSMKQGTVKPVPTISVTPGVQLNLQGPFICRFSTAEATISAYIKDKNVAGTIQMKTGTNNLWLKNDCVYIWTGSKSGQKICGLSPYISLLQTLPLNNILSGGIPSTILNSLGVSSASLPVKPGDMTSFMNSCEKKEIKDVSVFVLPKNVVFQEKKL